MKKNVHFETEVYIDKFYGREYQVTIDFVDGKWVFTDPWTKIKVDGYDLDYVLDRVKDVRRGKRHQILARVEKAVEDGAPDWPTEAGRTVTYMDNGKTLATVVCAHGGEEQRYCVQLYGLPAFLSTPFSALNKTHLLALLQAAKQQQFSHLNDVAPELEKAFAEFAKEA